MVPGVLSITYLELFSLFKCETPDNVSFVMILSLSVFVSSCVFKHFCRRKGSAEFSDAVHL